MLEKEKSLIQKWMKEKKPGKEQFIICILTGILLLVIAMPVSGNSQSKKYQSGLSGNKDGGIKAGGEITPFGGEAEQKTVEKTGTETAKETKTGEVEEYESYVEHKLEQAISSMEGAGRVKVMVTVSASKELVVEKDMPVIRNNTTENDAEGGNRSVSEWEETEETVYGKESDGSSRPYVIKTLQPVIEGVVVVAEGGGSVTVNKNITEAIVALFGVEPHKIKVVKMKSE